MFAATIKLLTITLISIYPHPHANIYKNYLTTLSTNPIIFETKSDNSDPCTKKEIFSNFKCTPLDPLPLSPLTDISNIDKITDITDEKCTLNNIPNKKSKIAYSNQLIERTLNNKTFINSNLDSIISIYDLNKNKESNTNYKGEEPNAIWAELYKAPSLQPTETNNNIKKELVRIVSGIHSSVNIHIICNNKEIECFKSAIDLDLLKSKFEIDDITSIYDSERYRNLIYLADVLHSAISLYIDHIAYVYSKDESLSQLLKATFNNTNSNIIREELKGVREEIKGWCFGAQELMNCVKCDKCRLWGKVQVKGVSAALDILSLDLDSAEGEEGSRISEEECNWLINCYIKICRSIFNVGMIEKRFGGGWARKVERMAKKLLMRVGVGAGAGGG